MKFVEFLLFCFSFGTGRVESEGFEIRVSQKTNKKSKF